ncbi:MAG: WG repeat-containing protein [Candidatus Melainabacteria bacterium]|nr:WG repeat-containing protein [Candidatus Melainabacteria bacterium]
MHKNREVFEDGLIPVLAKYRWGYVSAATGKFVIEPQFADAGGFHNGMARVILA